MDALTDSLTVEQTQNSQPLRDPGCFVTHERRLTSTHKPHVIPRLTTRSSGTVKISMKQSALILRRLKGTLRTKLNVKKTCL